MEVSKSAAQLPTQAQELTRRKRPMGLQMLGESATTEILEDHVLGRAIGRYLVVEERHDVVVNPDPAEDPGFSLSPFRVKEHRVGLDERKRDLTIHLAIPSKVGLLTITFAEDPFDHVPLGEQVPPLCAPISAMVLF